MPTESTSLTLEAFDVPSRMWHAPVHMHTFCRFHVNDPNVVTCGTLYQVHQVQTARTPHHSRGSFAKTMAKEARSLKFRWVCGRRMQDLLRTFLRERCSLFRRSFWFDLNKISLQYSSKVLTPSDRSYRKWIVDQNKPNNFNLWS